MNKTKFFSSLLVGLLVTTGLFTSCKDYDDDIKNLQQQIDQKSLKTDLESLKTSLETRLATLESTLNTKEAALKAEIEKKADKTALDAKADKTDLTALAARVKAVEDLTAEIAGIKTKIAAIELTLGQKADKSELKDLEDKLTILINAKADQQALEDAVATLTGKINERLTEDQVKAIVDASATLQTKALNDFKAEINDKLGSLLGLSKDDIEKLTDVNGKIAAIEDALKAFTGAETIDEAKKKMQELAEKINENVAAVNILEAFVKKQLTSMVLMPSFYWEGLEGIEVPFGTSPIFKEKKEDYAFTYTVKKAMGDEQVKVTVKSTMGFDATVYDKDHKNVGTYFLYSEKIASTPSFWPQPTGTAGPANLTGANAEIVLDGITKSTLRKDGVGTDYANINYAKLMQGGVAKYHYNPSTADLTGFTVSFFENDAEVYTRGNNGAVVATPRTEDITAENGILTVPFDVDGDKLMSMFKAWTTAKTTEPETADSYTQPVTGGATWKGEGWGNSAQDNDGSFGRGAKLPFIAAQLTSTGEKVDTTITSDYGVLVPAVLEIVALADNDPIDGSYFTGYHDGYTEDDPTTPTVDESQAGRGQIRANHLYESVGYKDIVIDPSQPNNGYNNYGAITMPATHEIVYTEKAFDLKPFIDTHVSYTNYARYGTSTIDRVMTAAEMEALGLHYEFTIVDYIVGNEKTSQSAHIIKVDANGNPTDDAKSGCFSVRSVDEDGKTMVNEKATLETVGREPLIRVDLKDEAGNIVRYGYIKLRVVKDKAEDMSITFNMNDMYMNCGEASKLTWSQVENKLLRQINMTKEDFEKLYHLDVVKGYANMPYINPTADQKTNGVQDPSGALYADANANKWMAVRWYNAGTDEAPNYKKVPTIVDGSDDLSGIKDDVFKADKQWKWTTSANWFGRVWYTPHDNSTTTHNWDENTNVLEWNFGEVPEGQNLADATNMQRKAYEQMMKVLGVTYKSKGLNTKALSTTVRFIHKNGSSIYVTMTFAPGKIHFPYGDINRRVLDHWYSMTQGYADASGKQYTDTIEVYANVPTPAEIGQANNLDYTMFTKDLKEYWLSKQIIPEIHNLYKADGETPAFTKFWNYETNKYVGDVTFQFRLPKKGENADFSADKDGQWKVKGISGNEYTLKLNNAKNQIIALKNEKAGMSANEVICTLDKTNGIIHYNGRLEDLQSLKSKGVIDPYEAIQDDKVNGAASDILNYIGMFDATGKNQKEFYVTKQQDKAFTAFVEIKVANEACYDPIIGHNFFNVRFLRPINVWPAETSITDAPNATQFIDIWKLLYIRDWRTYAVVPAGKEQQFGKAAVAGTGLDGKKHNGNFDEGNVTYQFYNISNLYVQRDSIRSDAYLEADKRVVLTNADDIKKLYSIDDIPALTNGPTQYLKIITAAQADKTTYSVAGVAGQVASKKYDDVLAYTNNGGVVKPFHIYVPIAVEYAWGALDIYTQRVWAVITVDPTVGNE